MNDLNRQTLNLHTTTEITLPKETYQDYSVVVSIDRKRGNPNRVIEMGVYEFDEVGDVAETASKASIVLLTEKPKSIEQMKITSSTSGEVKIVLGNESMKIKNVKIIDVLGREIGYYSSNELKGKKEIKIDSRLKNGIYFVRIETSDGIITEKVNIIK
ncbi:MAG: T9SS type A sorting domain-containing protein [bacterium]